MLSHHSRFAAWPLLLCFCLAPLLGTGLPALASEGHDGLRTLPAINRLAPSRMEPARQTECFADAPTEVEIEMVGDVESLNPVHEFRKVPTPGKEITELMYGPLLKLIGRELEPNLGSNYEIAEDGLTYFVGIDSAATWADGQPVTSEDVLFSFELAQEMIPEIRPYLQEYLNLEESTAVAEKTVSFTLRSTYDDFALNVLTTVPIVPKHIWEELRGTEAWLTSPAATGEPCEEAKLSIVGAGRYAFGWREPGVKVVVDAKNPHWTDSPRIARYVWRVNLPSGELSSSDERCATAGSESEHWMIPNVPGAEIDPCVARLPGRDFVVQEFPTSRLTYVGLNQDVFADPLVRQALLQSIDREALAEQLLNGHGQAALGLQSPQAIGFDEESAQLYPFDPETAVALLDQSGLVDSNFDLVYRAASASDAAAAAAIAQQWSEIGLEVQPIGLDGSEFVEVVYRDQSAAAFLDSFEGLP